MKLSNSDQPLPDVFYIFVNQRTFMAAHNFAVGSFASAAFSSFTIPGFLEKYLLGTTRYLPYAPTETDLAAVSPFLLNTIGDYIVEYDLETFREKNHRLLPSRLSATYAFGSADACLQVSNLYGWDMSEVRRFKLKDHPFNRVARVDMEIISVARDAHAMPAHVCNRYWTGQPGLFGGRAPLWEYLIEGVLERTD